MNKPEPSDEAKFYAMLFDRDPADFVGVYLGTVIFKVESVGNETGRV
jgi:hypothetical protein